ncbi:MAG TPA: ABC transporter permease [Candidatus Acidoferrales bacterium]|nr:ABC transporter permease [Candidatus Acidoferrales bacterium]
MRILLQDLRYSLRMLAKTPAFTTIAILTLALGIGANTAIFSVIQTVLLRPLPYPHPEELVEISNTYPPQIPKIGLSPGDFNDWRRENQSFSEMGAYYEITQGFNLTGDGDPERVQVLYATSGLFPMLGIRPVAGRSFLPEEDQRTGTHIVVLGHRLWQSRFGGDPAIVGRGITLDQQRYMVVGVLPASSAVINSPDLWMPMSQFQDDLNEHVHHGMHTIARLRRGVTLARAQAEITSLNHQETIDFPASHKNIGAEVHRLEDPSAAKLRRTLLVLFGAVGLVLLIACANIVSLLLARNSAREKEIALRAALGASQTRLIRQLLTESILLAVFGAAAGLVLAAMGIRILSGLVPVSLDVVRESALNAPVLAFAAAICLFSGVLCGLLPAAQARTRHLYDVLKQGGKGSSGLARQRLHSALVIAEIALALIPLAGAGLLLRSFRQLLEDSPGFETSNVLTMQVAQAAAPPEQLAQLSTDQLTALTRKQSLQFQQIEEQIGGLPGVKSAGGISTLPLGTETREVSRFLIEGQTVEANKLLPVAQFRTASLGYFFTLGIPLISGREFTQEDWALQNVLVNDTMSRRFWPESGAVGKRINLCSLDPKPCWLTIVGVVGNVHQMGLDGAPTYDVYFTGGWTNSLVIRTAGDPHARVSAVTEVIHKADPTLPVTRVMSMEQLFSDVVAPRRFSAVLIGVFAALALLLAAVGIYGVMSYTVGQRTREIGIRMALGAQPGNMLRFVMARGARLALAGIVLGLAGSLALTRYLATLLFGVQATDPITFTGVAALLLIVALLACYVPARRAMRVDPILALRHE